MTIQSGSVNRLSTKLSASLPPQVELCLNSCEYENTPHAMTYHNNHQVSKFSQVDSCVQTKPKKAQTSQCRYLSTFTLSKSVYDHWYACTLGFIGRLCTVHTVPSLGRLYTTNSNISFRTMHRL